MKQKVFYFYFSFDITVTFMVTFCHIRTYICIVMKYYNIISSKLCKISWCLWLSHSTQAWFSVCLHGDEWSEWMKPCLCPWASVSLGALQDLRQTVQLKPILQFCCSFYSNSFKASSSWSLLEHLLPGLCLPLLSTHKHTRLEGNRKFRFGVYNKTTSREHE